MRQRKNVTTLTGGELALWRSAVDALKHSVDPAKNYAHWAAIHARSCPHWCELFLPWHRAYILQYENALRDAVHSDTLTLPYWDWTATRQVPDAFAQPDNNPLWCDRYTDAQRTSMALTLPTAGDRDQALQPSGFNFFGGVGCDNSGCKGSLEGIHDFVHAWVGPAMSLPDTAACDPIFWSHHAYVDKLWAQWQIAHPGQNPRCLTMPLPGLDSPAVVPDMLDIGTLGYEYVEASDVHAVQRGTVVDRYGFEARLTVPPRFDRAMLILHGVNVQDPRATPTFVDVFVSDKLAATSCLFGLHAMGGHEHMAMVDVQPCFPPVVSNHIRGNCFGLDLTAAFREFAGGPAPAITLGLRGAGQHEMRLGVQRIELLFPG